MKLIKYGSIIVDFLTIIQLISVISQEVTVPLLDFIVITSLLLRFNVFSPVMFSCYLQMAPFLAGHGYYDFVLKVSHWFSQ